MNYNASGNHACGLLFGIAAGIVISLAAVPFVKESKKEEKEEETPLVTIPDEFRQEQLSRNILYFGKTSMARISSSRVLVVGCDGIGSHTAIMLARSGIKYLCLVDDGIITPTSIKHHACATLKSMGKKKVDVLKQCIFDISLDSCNVKRREFFNVASSLDEEKWDFIVDTTDDVATKCILIDFCILHKIKIVSCMNTESRCDPTRLNLGSLASASCDLMATQVRHGLVNLDCSDFDSLVSVVYSSERIDSNNNNIPNLLPSIIGQTCASWVLCQLGNKPYKPVTVERTGRQFRHR